MNKRLKGAPNVLGSVICLLVLSGVPSLKAAEMDSPENGSVDFENLPGPADWQDLPDWSGTWQMVGNTIFDHATVEPPGGSSHVPGTREYPPYNEEWEKKYQHNIELKKQERFPDPLTMCGIFAGFPRIFNVPNAYEFVVRPEQTWILTENGPNVMRIYTDGRSHAPADMRWPTFFGDSVGYWDGDTLVFETVSVKAEQTIIDRTGLIHSNALRGVTRIRKVDENTMQVDMTLYDDKAFTGPWHVTKQFKRIPDHPRVYPYACNENNRNPVTQTGETIVLGPDGEPLLKPADGTSVNKQQLRQLTSSMDELKQQLEASRATIEKLEKTVEAVSGGDGSMSEEMSKESSEMSEGAE